MGGETKSKWVRFSFDAVTPFERQKPCSVPLCFRFPVFAEIKQPSHARARKDNIMSVFLLTFSLFVILAGVFALRDILYVRQVESHGKAREILP